jgi:tetratricopeptide (TPR) repeat protein
MDLAARAPADALRSTDRALELEPANSAFLLHRAESLAALGRRREALEAAAVVEAAANLDAGAWSALGTLRSFAGDPRGALAAYERAIALRPQDPRLLFNRATARRFLGDVTGAEADYDRVIAQNPRDFEAYLNRSELRVQSVERNHAAELEAVASAGRLPWQGEIPLRFALAKEYEDLGHFARSFDHLRTGARLRRAHLSYDVATDVATVDWIIAAHPAGSAGARPAPARGGAGPIFVVGLPRSGSTLIERVLSRHTTVSGAAELDGFAMALTAAVGRRGGARRIARREMVELSAILDFDALGAGYLARARAALDGTGPFIDKMPLNYLYCGLIRRALPDAPIVHVTRHPMAVCYAMYKTLFREGYPFSYDLEDIARYYAAYRRLMEHWRAAFPGGLYEVRYERVVADLPREARRLLEHCGLEWEEQCSEFHENPEPSMTASAAQVRRPLYDSSVGLWRHYSSQLAGLRERLIAEGIPIAELDP